MQQPSIDTDEHAQFNWGERTVVMGILNLAPDSFSGDGIDANIEEAVRRARQMEADGADVIDVGGQSTRPDHVPISAEEELRRVAEPLREIARTISIPISIDTSRAVVADAALRAGARMVNDVRGLTADPELASVVAEASAPVVIMHDIQIVDQSRMMSQIVREMSERIELALAAGIAWEDIILDPGFGFGKQAPMNLELLRRLGELRVFDRPILSGTSRKGTIGLVLGLPADERVEGTAATVAIAIANGADIVRVHDVREMVRVARMTDAIMRGTWHEHILE
jgi:dihydropteroate synthase